MYAIMGASGHIGHEIAINLLKKGEKVPETKYYFGTVVNGYRSGDGCVSYVLDELKDSTGGWGSGFAVPTVLQDSEYKYFRKNKEDFKEWLNNCDKNYNGKKIVNQEMFEKLYE